MEQLPTKEQILEKHVQLYFSSHHDKSKWNGEGEHGGAEWHTNKAIAADIYKAMEEYAAVRAMPLVENIKDFSLCITELWNKEGPIDRDLLMGRAGSIVERAQYLLSSYTGEQPETTQEQSELEQLRQWKQEAMEVYGPIHEYAQSHPKARLGTSIVAFVVERARKYDDLQKGEQPAKQPADPWISVDTPPAEGGRYWCFVQEINSLGISHFQWNCYYDPQANQWRDNLQTFHVTHWMPLPQPPKAREQPLKSEG